MKCYVEIHDEHGLCRHTNSMLNIVYMETITNKATSRERFYCNGMSSSSSSS